MGHGGHKMMTNSGKTAVIYRRFPKAGIKQEGDADHLRCGGELLN